MAELDQLRARFAAGAVAPPPATPVMAAVEPVDPPPPEWSRVPWHDEGPHDWLHVKDSELYDLELLDQDARWVSYPTEEGKKRMRFHEDRESAPDGARVVLRHFLKVRDIHGTFDSRVMVVGHAVGERIDAAGKWFTIQRDGRGIQTRYTVLPLTPPL